MDMIFCPFSSLMEAADRSKSFCRNRFLERTVIETDVFSSLENVDEKLLTGF